MKSNQFSIEALKNSSKEERISQIRDLVKEQLTTLLGLSEDEDIGQDESFIDLGMDSLVAAQLGVKLGEIVQKPDIITSQAAFDYPSIESLSKFIEETLFPA